MIVSREEVLERKHAEKLPDFCREVLNESGFSVHNLEGVAVSIGPGSFTGLRIGLSFAKGIAFSADLPLVPVPTLLAMAEASSLSGIGADTCLRSHKEIVYHQRFKLEANGWAAESRPDCGEWEAVAPGIAKESCFIHFGCNDLLDRLEQEVEILESSPSAVSVARVALNRFEELSMTDYHHLEPDYISSFKTGGSSSR
ncbi:MAG: tRNA (adenosine(37)-N6)-threonylcarbamoyltransferase complex dimerization subunit type 1 TsaB [Candidatus Neomarinimicrobiota bacterium]|nr:tRNA (adenosine(37)-N6)-threonylcarbamoyltransferase complex dimerization subunit type 1 TsaB [Candidatus Neomarinimicrobiota bacterium]